MIDYKVLLEKYIGHIVGEEGIDYISTYMGSYSDVKFTEDEKKVLNEISDKLDDIRNER